jgi:mono/diheme cytochrome c family protein
MSFERGDVRGERKQTRRSGHALATAVLLAAGVAATLLGARTTTTVANPDEVRLILDAYCVGCHNERRATAGLALDALDVGSPADAPHRWEAVIRKLRTGTMPPGGELRPEPREYDLVAGWRETGIDRAAAAAAADPGTTSPVHRLNRLEYNNAVNDLLGLDVDVRSLLPGDETADGSFDNFADALSITTTHMERYLSVARHVTRLAVGLPPSTPGVETFEVPLHVVQD